MKAIIIEDEKNSAQILQNELIKLDETIQVLAVLESVAASVLYLKNTSEVDLIFMDIKLNDGYSFEIFEQVSVAAPVVFTTAYDEYVIRAFQHNGIDYLLKPISSDKLSTTLQKFRMLEKHFVLHNLHSIVEQIYTSNKPQRIVVKKGKDFQTVSLSQVVYFFVDQKIVFCVDRHNRKYITEWTNLSDAIAALDERSFFKANRKFIVHSEYIKGFKHIEFSRTKLEMEINPGEEIIISQENSAYFKNWIREQ